MKRLSEFLGKIRTIQARQASVNLAVQEALKNKLSLEVPFESVVCKGSTVTLKGIDQAARSAIFIKKQAVLEDINRLQSIKVIKDIR